MLAAQLGGLGPFVETGIITSLGGVVGWYLEPDDILSLEIKKLTYFVSGDYGSTLDSTLVGVHYKHFLGNSFYVKGGLDHHGFRAGSSRVSSSATRDYSEGRLLAAVFAIGNQWQIGAFTIGCDWGGVMLPLSKTLSREDSPNTSSYGNSTTIELVQFYLGASF